MLPARLVAPVMLACVAVLGGSAGLSFLATADATLGPGHLAAILFVATLLGATVGGQMYRRDLADSTLVGCAAGAVGIFAFFATPFYVLQYFGYLPPEPRVLATFLLVAPLTAAGLSGAGTLFLAMGVRRYRAKNGMVHAPR